MSVLGMGNYKNVGWGMDGTDGVEFVNFDNPMEIRTPDTPEVGAGMDFSNYMAMGKLGLGALQAGLAYKNYGLQKDAFNFNKMDRNRAYEANRLKYNNQLGRTAAVDSHYGTKSSGTKL